MTDLIEKIAEAIRPEIEETFHDGKLNAKARRGKACILDLAESRAARAALSVIKENAGDLVRPLAWTDAQSFRNVAQGQGGIYELGKVAVGEAVMRFIPDGWDDDDELENLGHASTVEECVALKAKAQQHHTARVLSLLNLEVE